MRSGDAARRRLMCPLRPAVRRDRPGRPLPDLQLNQCGRRDGVRELRREVPRTRVRWTHEAIRAGVSRGRIPTPDPPTEPREGPEPRCTRSRSGVPLRGWRTRPAGRIGGRRWRGGGLPLETRGAVRPDAGTAEAAARADGSPPGTRALADPGARIIP